MTPLKPLENLRVRGVAAERYRPNEKCSHPECNEPAVDQHHCFPRSQIKSDSWFVEIIEDLEIGEVSAASWPEPTPHVTGLCREHHDAVESHAAWIRLEDGVFVWYDRYAPEGGPLEGTEQWEPVGPLNPQPGSREGKPKRKKFQGEARRSKATVSIKVPQDSREDGAGVLLDLLEQAGEVIVKVGLYKDPPPAYYIYVAALTFFVTHALEVEGAA